MKGPTPGMARAPMPASQPSAPPPMPVQRVLLIDSRSDEMLREYNASVPLAVLAAGPAVVRQGDHWRDYLLRTLDAKDPAVARQTAVVIVDDGLENGLHEGGRIARLHPDTPVFVLTPPGAGVPADQGISRPIFTASSARTSSSSSLASRRLLTAGAAGLAATAARVAGAPWLAR